MAFVFCPETRNKVFISDMFEHGYYSNFRHSYILEIRSKRNLLKMMYNESKNDVNIDVYLPQMVLKGTKNVKMKHKFTQLTKIQKRLDLWDKLPHDMQNIGSKKEFKNRVKRYILVS